jgi:hypothetical protein
MPVSLPVEELSDAPGQLPGMGGEASDGGQVRGSNEHRTFDREPCKGLLMVVRTLQRYPGLDRRRLYFIQMWMQPSAASPIILRMREM